MSSWLVQMEHSGPHDGQAPADLRVLAGDIKQNDDNGDGILM